MRLHQYKFNYSTVINKKAMPNRTFRLGMFALYCTPYFNQYEKDDEINRVQLFAVTS